MGSELRFVPDQIDSSLAWPPSRRCPTLTSRGLYAESRESQAEVQHQLKMHMEKLNFIQFLDIQGQGPILWTLRIISHCPMDPGTLSLRPSYWTSATNLSRLVVLSTVQPVLEHRCHQLPMSFCEMCWLFPCSSDYSP